MPFRMDGERLQVAVGVRGQRCGQTRASEMRHDLAISPQDLVQAIAGPVVEKRKCLRFCCGVDVPFNMRGEGVKTSPKPNVG
jgi:hypothetical protein